MYAYIDESGDNGRTKKSTKNFVVTAIVVDNENILSKIARKVFKRKIKNKSNSNMLHAHRDTESIHKALLKKLDNLDYFFTYTLDKNYIKSLEILFQKLYLHRVEKVYLAKKDSRKSVSMEIVSLAKKYKLSVVITSPVVEKGLQIVDFISWVIFRKEEFLDDLYFNKIVKNFQK